MSACFDIVAGDCPGDDPGFRALRQFRTRLAAETSATRAKAASSVRGNRYQPWVPAGPLNGPTRSLVIHPP